MEFTLRYGSSYRSVIFKLSAYSVLSIFGCILLGYIFLPFAAASYAALLTFENRGKRVMSYAIPAVMFTINFLIRVAFSLEAVAYIVLGVLLYFAAQKGWSKSESAVWMMIATLVLIVISAILIAFEETGAVAILSIKQFYSNIFLNLKENIINHLTSLVTVNADGAPIFVFDLYDAECIFNELYLSLVPIIIIISFALVGFSFKLFEMALRSNAIEETALSKWRFGASNLTCYFYIVVAVLSLIAENDGSIFIYTLISLNTVLSVIFAYLGFRFVYNILLSKGRSSLFAIALLVLAFIMFSSSALTILSYIGVTVTIIFNRASTTVK